MKSEPQNEHRWLQKLVGEWTYEQECSMDPDKPPGKFKGSECVRSLGGFWVVCEARGDMPGGEMANTLMTLGYDSGKKRYVGTWVGSMMSHMWVYDGYLDSEGKVLTLETEGPDCIHEGKLAQDKDVIEFNNDDHRVWTSYRLDNGGNWRQFMTVNYWRNPW